MAPNERNLPARPKKPSNCKAASSPVKPRLLATCKRRLPHLQEQAWDLQENGCLLTLERCPDAANSQFRARGPPSFFETACPEHGTCQVDTTGRPFEERKAPVNVTRTLEKKPAVFQQGQKRIRNTILITMALHWWQTPLSRSPVSSL